MAAAVRATQLTGLPAQFAELMADRLAGGRQAQVPLTQPPPQPLRLVITGDAAIPAGLVPGLRQRFGVGVEVGYGCAEAGLGLRTCADDAGADVEGCVGTPAPGVTLALRDTAGHEVPHGELGEVLIRSDACMNGYWNDAQASAAAFTSDHFVRTGDLGRLDDEGRLVLAATHGPRDVS